MRALVHLFVLSIAGALMASQRRSRRQSTHKDFEARNMRSIPNGHRCKYDRHIETALEDADPELKKRLAAVIDQLYELGGDLPPRINENRNRLARQIAKVERE